MMKGFYVTDGNEDLTIVTTSRAKATGAFTAMKGFYVTDGSHDLTIVTTSRAKATGAFIARFGRWKRLRTRREPE